MARLIARATLVAACGLALVACRTGTNYTAPDGPRHASDRVDRVERPRRDASVLRIISFNVAFAKQVDRAIDLLATDSTARGADVILLQEMDETGTRRIANALDMHFVYYPAIRSHRTKRDFGNAVLSRWPIVEDAKLILPHTAFLRGTQRVATAATIQYGEVPVRVYSTHLGTSLEISGAARADQLRAILDDARRYTRVVVGGDMNSHGVGELAVELGYHWPTKDGPKTTRFGRWDHIFLKGMSASGRTFSGTIHDARDASDHLPVWATAVVR